MSLLRVSLRLLPLLALVAACTGKRADPEPSQNPPPSTGEGGAGGANGGAPSNGGNGAGPATGGAPSTGGMGGTSATGTGGGNASLNDPSDFYPFCGCIADAMMPGACGNCVTTAAAACPELPDCVGDCSTMVDDLRACTFGDLGCIQAAFDLNPEQFDDAIAVIKCECTACSDPICDNTACGG